MVLRLPSLPRRQRNNRRSITKIIARPATPPTMPPTRSCVGGVPLPPELLFELDEVGEVGAVAPELPLPPAPAAVTTALEIADASDAWLENCDDTDVDTDVKSVAGVDVICAELALKA